VVEGSLWVYGSTRLTDFYEGRLSLRELGNRFFSLPPEAPIWAVLDEERERQEAQRQVSEIENTLSPFKT
jgi:hypothetical protein